MEKFFKKFKTLGTAAAVVASLGAGAKNLEAKEINVQPKSGIEMVIKSEEQKLRDENKVLINQVREPKNLVLNTDPNIEEYKRDSFEINKDFGLYQVKKTTNGNNIAVEFYTKTDARRGYVANTMNIVITPEVAGANPNEVLANITINTTTGKMISSEPVVSDLRAAKIINNTLHEFLK